MNIAENVEHYLLECQNYNVERQNMFYILSIITSYFNNNINRNILSLLFPHLWQSHLNWKEERYKELMKLNLMQRVNILKEIYFFVNNSETFKDREM